MYHAKHKNCYFIKHASFSHTYTKACGKRKEKKPQKIPNQLFTEKKCFICMFHMWTANSLCASSILTKSLYFYLFFKYFTVPSKKVDCTWLQLLVLLHFSASQVDHLNTVQHGTTILNIVLNIVRICVNKSSYLRPTSGFSFSRGSSKW